MLDFLIKNASVCTGLLEKAQVVNIGIQADKIVVFNHKYEYPKAKQVIEGAGLILAPGFVDPTHVAHPNTGNTGCPFK